MSVVDGRREKDERANGPAVRRDARVEGFMSKKSKPLGLLYVDGYLVVQDGSRCLIGGDKKEMDQDGEKEEAAKREEKEDSKLTIRKALHVSATQPCSS